ncbi:ABC transporter substrate-binding protein [Anaerocolumna xylanovorans]|uniref:Multiple sugar transport system substrate-binding protein n=1 Tax=Anaerocolumna xylanovorans DSM 12503 TaxID=1121345 RepID=A0A1M7Y8E9_9FIRM|nr:ABC transporter substrate-binding protein [Anaerocolumna xylanovorans]SHO48897.1 multiple sugar transport system substrate-binding protein [Anaerocolumna xylanovorans DSM 12503]
MKKNAKSNLRKAAALLLTMGMVAGMLSGCGSSDKKNVQDTSSGDNSTDGKTVEITMWGSWGGDQVGQLDKQLDAYNKSQSKYHITYAVQDSMEEKLLTAIVSNEAPDVVLWDRFNTSVYAPKGAFTQLDDYVKKDSIDMSKFYSPATDELTYDGKLYGIPLTVDTRVIFYNKDMFSAAGIDPASITTWDTLRDAAVKLTKRENGKLVQAGFSLKDVGLFNNWIQQAGGKMIDDSSATAKAAFNSDAGLAVLKYWNQLLNEDKVYDLGFEDGFGGDGFKAGKVAMTFNGPWTLQSYKEAGVNFGVIGQPEGPTGAKSAMMGGFGLIVPNKAKHADAAWDFIKWWTTKPENGVEFAKISGNLPANIDAAKDPYFMDDDVLKVFSDTMSYAGIRSKVPGYSDLEGLALIPQLQKYVAGEISAEDALANAQKQGDTILAEAAGK